MQPKSSNSYDTDIKAFTDLKYILHCGYSFHILIAIK